MADGNAKNRLGRGLAALIGDIEPENIPGQSTGEMRADLMSPIEHVRANANNPRRIFQDAELQELTNSILEHGIVQPILVRTIVNEDLAGAKYEIIAGERRWRAAQKAGLHEIPILVRDVEDRQALEIAIIENVQRADLNAVEEAEGYHQLMNDYDYTQSELARVIGKSRSHLANTLRLLKLPPEVQVMVISNQISAGHARALITARDALTIANRIRKEGLSVRQTEGLLKKQNTDEEDSETVKAGTSAKDTDIVALENRLADVLGLKVSVSFKKGGSGDVQIFYKNLEQLDEICRRLEQ